MAAWTRWSLRRDEAVLRWLQRHPGTCDTEIADGLRRSVSRVHRRLLRLEREGRVKAAWTRTDDFFDFVIYYATPHAERLGG